MSSECSRSSPTARALNAAASVLLAEVGPASGIVIDGRSGAGKSSLARELVRRWPWTGEVRIVALDDVYPGWDGLSAGSDYACSRVLTPWSAGRDARWQRWDWAQARYDRQEQLLPGSALIVEGSGALTPVSAGLATVRVWLEAGVDERRERALARDGRTYEPHWQRWALQEDEHIRLHDPRSLATHVFDIP